MKLIDIIVIGLLAVWVIFSVIYIVRRKKNGKSSCGCCNGDCAGCLRKNKKDK